MWEIYPSGIYELLKRVWLDYRPKRILITENGIPLSEGPDLDGQVRDIRRIQYLQDHLVYLHKAIAEGVPVDGYFVWTLMDNFEWAYGTRTRFGLAYTDFETQKRTVKASGRWFKHVADENGFVPQLYAREV
jgi:beta-glucosidase